MSSSLNTSLSLRQAAIIAGVTYLTNPVSYAEFSLFPKLVVAHNIQATVQNISTHQGMFVGAIACYLVNGLGDIVIAWALYYLLAPVSRALSLLTALFQLVYAGLALCSVFRLVGVFNMLQSPDYEAAFGPAQFNAQMLYLLRSFHNEWDLSLVLFGIHLMLVGVLIFRCRYIPRWLGFPVVVAGIGYVVNFIGPYVFPGTDFWKYTSIALGGELALVLWLLIRGWSLKENSSERVAESV